MEVVEDKKRWAEELVNRSLGSLGIHRRGEEVERKKEAERVKGEKEWGTEKGRGDRESEKS